MKRTFALFLVFIMLLTLAACGGRQPGDDENIQSSGQEANNREPEPGDALSDEGDGIVYASYEAYDNAWSDFNSYIINKSEGHEIVSVHQSTVMPIGLKNFTYLLPLSFLGQSYAMSGKFDPDLEAGMLQKAWSKDVKLSYDENQGYLLTGTDDAGSALELKVRYDKKSDSLRLEAYKDGALELLFEYCKTPDGYAAQYHCQDVVGMDKTDAVYGLCTYRLIFAGENGSCSRFDNVTSEPDSIYGGGFDKQSFIEGATHFFTIADGEFAGKLGGQDF
ncbi:MAG: hypothetical protein GX541_06745 [Clostridiales bacterium]|nr:hypothetical protein [Clostridiales bacterium]